MHKYAPSGLFFVFFCSCLPGNLAAQSLAPLVDSLTAVHNLTNSSSCDSPRLVSNRAMNLHLADKVGYYLSAYNDLSYFKNYITLDAVSGIFSLNHNLFQARGKDELVRSFNLVGVRTNLTAAVTKLFTDKHVANELGLTVQRVWVGRTRTRIAHCDQQMIMQARRTVQLELLKIEIAEKEKAHVQVFEQLMQGDASPRQFDQYRQQLKNEWSESAANTFNRKFAAAQSALLHSTPESYRRIVTHWTQLSTYLPVILSRFTVAESMASKIQQFAAYPVELTLSHTRYWESSKNGRLLLNVQGGLQWQNAARVRMLRPFNQGEYKVAGGVDTAWLHQQGIHQVYVGNFRQFLHSSLLVKLVYFPATSHIGISTSLEKTLGQYRVLNWELGFPIVLIDAGDIPACNFLVTIRYFDLAKQVVPERSFKNNVSINLTVAVPFSKIVY